MNDSVNHSFKLPPEQQAIRDKCFHPSGTFVEFPLEDVETSIAARFEKIAIQFPNRIAVQRGGDVWTYARLNYISNQIARITLARLRSQGQPVVLLFAHQPQIVAAILAVLKSANLYVPLDSSYPVDRLRYMIEDSTAKLILTDNEHFALAQRLAAEDIEIVNIDDLDAQPSGENLNPTLTPFHHAYVVYTSGSTGGPKGVLHSHRNVLHSVFVETNSMHICTDDRIGLLHSFSSSASTKFLYAALLNGASLMLFDVKQEGVERLRLWLIRERVTLCEFNPTLFRRFAHNLKSAGNFPLLRLIILGSEAVTADDVALYRRVFHPQSNLVILFATSETATIRSYFVNPTRDDHSDGVPVGYPIEGKSIALIDETGNRIEPGKVGEIAAKSRYLAVGYWRQPDLTKAKFLPDPKGGDERIYPTGDLGRVGADGLLFHLGRKDSRVKIRGFTVEPLEAELLLQRHPTVKAVAVVGRGPHADDQQLIAYCVPASDAAPAADELTQFMQASLPSHMVPSKFVMIDALPLTPNGKLDRQALPAPDTSRPKLRNPFLAPRNPVEASLMAIWGDILNFEQIGVSDNFFDLGGHSLAASQVISRVIEAFQLELPVKALFDAPTIAEMAAIVTQYQAKRASNVELAQMLSEVEAMTEEEAQKLLAGEDARSSSEERHG